MVPSGQQLVSSPPDVDDIPQPHNNVNDEALLTPPLSSDQPTPANDMTDFSSPN